MSIPTLEIGNSGAFVQNLPRELFRLLRYELSYQTGEPGRRVDLMGDGTARIHWWDGYTTLLRKSGWMPAGLVKRAVRLLRKWGVEVQEVDRRTRPAAQEPLWSLAATLRPYQERAVEAAWAAGRGVVDSPPRTGKTLMMIELVRRVSAPTVVTAPTIQIAKQTWERFRAELGGDSRDFYLLTGGPPATRKAHLAAKMAKVYVATADTAMAMSEEWWEGISCLIVDERHHQAAEGYHRLNELAGNAYFRWGFTGTNFRSKPGENLALEAVLGETVAKFSIQEMRDLGVLVPARVKILVMDQAKRLGKSAKFASAYNRGIVRSEQRNEMIAWAAKELVAAGRRVLVLVERIEHGKRLEELIPRGRFIQAEDGDRIREVTAALDSGEIRCVIGSPVVGEGLDIPAADALVYAKGMQARVTHTQDIFRVMTGAGSKTDAVIIDFADRHQEKLLEHSLERMRNYISMGCSVEVIDKGIGESVEGQLGFGPSQEAQVTIS